MAQTMLRYWPSRLISRNNEDTMQLGPRGDKLTETTRSSSSPASSPPTPKHHVQVDRPAGEQALTGWTPGRTLVNPEDNNWDINMTMSNTRGRPGFRRPFQDLRPAGNDHRHRQGGTGLKHAGYQENVSLSSTWKEPGMTTLTTVQMSPDYRGWPAMATGETLHPEQCKSTQGIVGNRLPDTCSMRGPRNHQQRGGVNICQGAR